MGQVHKQLINRKTYKAIKRYDRQEMETFAKNLYLEGMKDGVKNVEVKVDTDKVIDTFRQILRTKLGIGKIRFDKADIEQDIKELFSKEGIHDKERKEK